MAPVFSRTCSGGELAARGNGTEPIPFPRLLISAIVSRGDVLSCFSIFCHMADDRICREHPDAGLVKWEVGCGMGVAMNDERANVRMVT